MEQTIEESVEAEEIPEQEDSSELDRDGEDGPIIKREYNSKSLDNDKYEQNPNYKKIESKNTSKKSEKKGGLGKIVDESSNVSFTINKDGKIVPIYEDREVYGEGVSMPRWFIGVNADNSDSNRGEDTPNGSQIIVYYINPKTGRLEFLVEQKTVTYPVSEARGKFSFIGGAIKTNESDLEAAIRETGEEVSEPAASIIIRELIKKPQVYTTLYGTVDGQPVYTVIRKVKIESQNEWEILKYASMSEGIPRVLTDEDAIKYNNYFAFGYGPIIKEFISEKLGTKNYLPIKFVPFTYKDSFIPNYYSSPKSTSLVKLSMNQK